MSTLSRRISLFALISLLTLPLSRVEAGSWIQAEGTGAPTLSLEQSLWGMIGLPGNGQDWTLDEELEQIAKAGFDSVMGNVTSADEVAALAKKAKAHGLSLTLRTSVDSHEGLDRALEIVKKSGARGLIVEIRKPFATLDEGRLMIRHLVRRGEETGVACYLDLHRNSLTQDLGQTSTWAREIPGIQFDADLSHPVAAYGLGGELSGKIAHAFDAILARSGMLDGRVSNGQQLQIDVGPEADHAQARRFAGWWKKAMVNWLAGAKAGDVFVFRSELGPPPYAITDASGKELSDRWAQAIVLKDLAARLWNEAVKETGKGQPHGAKASGAGKGKMDLTVKKSPILTIRGVSHRVGDFYLAGQPAQPDLEKAVQELGVKTVINLRKDEELFGLGFEEDYTIELLEANYIHLATGPMVIDDALCEKFLKACREAPRPILIHGSNGNRVWGMWALYLAMDHDVPIDETKKQALELGVKRLVVEEFVRDYVKRHKK